jgi:hypothetical protein
LPLRFDVGPGAPSAAPSPPKSNAPGTAPSSSVATLSPFVAVIPVVASAKPSVPLATLVSQPSTQPVAQPQPVVAQQPAPQPSAAQPPSSLSRQSFAQAAPAGGGTAEQMAQKLVRIRQALIAIVDDLERRNGRIIGAIDENDADVHRLVPIASLFKAVRPVLERSQSILKDFALREQDAPPAHLDKLRQLKFLLHANANDMAGFISAAHSSIDDASAGPKSLQMIAEVLKDIQNTFVY